MRKLVPIDFEYNGTSEKYLNLVCCSLEVDGKVEEYWLFNQEKKKLELKQRLKTLRDSGYVFVCWNAIAEGSSFISLRLDPSKGDWIDLQAEWKMLINHNNDWAYGKQLIDGRKVTTTPPVYGQDKTVSNEKAKTNLVAGAYKLLGVELDTDHKTKMRDIIIEGNPDKIETNKKAIQDYCTSDIKYLVPMWTEIKKAYRNIFKERTNPVDGKSFNMFQTWDDILWRGETGVRTALMTCEGYPVDVDKLKAFAKNIPDLMRDLCEDINGQFDFDEPLFKWNNRDQRYSKNTKLMKTIIEESEYKDVWTKTPPSTRFPDGSYSLSIDVFEKMFSWRHDFPRGNPFSQYMRYLKTQRSLNGFIPKGKTAKNKETIFDSLGNDGRVRAYLNPYGSQSGRYQPKATSFIFLKSAWTRSLVSPKRGYVISGVDFKSEEFLLAGLIANDKNMLKAYESSDVYFYFAKLAGAVPMDGERRHYEDERTAFKSTVLGISYLMGPDALARKLTTDTGSPHTREDAVDLTQKFDNAFDEYANTRNQIEYTYRLAKCLKLPDGWAMGPDNPNPRSVKNMPIQGFGSSILRKSIQLAQDAGLKVIIPLHDALYIESKVENRISDLEKLLTAMREAFAFYFKEFGLYKEAKDLIKFDANQWGPGLDEGYFKIDDTDVKVQELYIDDRAVKEYNQFKKYMEV